MQQMDFLESLFDRKLVSVLRIFFRFSEKKFYLKEVADSSKVSQATTHRILTRLVRLGILDEIKISKFKVYQMGKNEKVTFLETFMKESVKVAEVFADIVKADSSIEEVILVGKETDTKANLLIIGEGINVDLLKYAASDIQDKYAYKITYISMEQAQYQQMSAMGLYPGVKKTLYTRGGS
jgi:DNA-binding Lrp family transcriptional regulator